MFSLITLLDIVSPLPDDPLAFLSFLILNVLPRLLRLTSTLIDPYLKGRGGFWASQASTSIRE